MTGAMPRELVVCSLEGWDDVWRRNQFLVRELLRRDPLLRVLFVEPPLDVVHSLRRRHPLGRTGLTPVADQPGLWRLRPRKVLPRIVGPFADDSLMRQLQRAVMRLGFTQPTLWVNFVNYAPLVARVPWPSVYDITDDWLLAPATPRELARTRRCEEILLREADEIVVCSPALAASRGGSRPVRLVPNAVDVEHFRSPRPRPPDLPTGPTAVYVGTLHEQRLDVALCAELALGHPGLTLVLVGPNALTASSSAQLTSLPNVHLLGPRPYHDVPAYLQHASVVVVPHVVTPFTESLDPIKAYECLAIEVPTVATPIAGFRELSDRLRVVPRERFVEAVATALAGSRPTEPARDVPDWRGRVQEFAAVLEQAGRRARRDHDTRSV